ncbi:MAG: transglutaminase domain-containing protein [Ruminococcus sp.]|nr:transglutaminase domain-containing protein [Ruminococcus sp.]
MTVFGIILCISVVETARPFIIEGLTAGLFAALLPALFSYRGKPEGRYIDRTNVRLLFSIAVSLAVAFFLRLKIASVIGGIYLYFEENTVTPNVPADSFITGLIVGYIFTLLIFYFQKILSSAPLIIAITFIVILQAIIYEYYTDSIPNIIGIFVLVISWVLQSIRNRSDDTGMIVYAIIVCAIAAVFGVFSVYKMEIKYPYLIENGASILRGEERLPSVNIPYIPMRDISKPSLNSTIIDDNDVSVLSMDGKFEFTGDDVLEVTMDFSAYNGSPVYLRHFFGANYNGTSWSDLTNEQISRQSEVISGFSTENLSPYDFDSHSFNEISPAHPSETVNFDFYVKNVGVNTRKPFLPYFLSVGNEFYNGGEILDSEDEYFGSVTMPSGFYENDEVISDILFDERAVQNPDLRADELNYRAFVYANYMDVPSDFVRDNPVLNDEYMEYITSENIQTGKSTLTNEQVFVRKINFIHAWLRDNCEYNIDVGEMPADKDFALYFLNEKREGFCQHFASSATLLCRAAGIPARYVTGFIISPSDYAVPSADGSVTVKDSRAHAWTEVYVNGYGWMPLDFTSGYSNVRTSLTAAERQERLSAQTLPANTPVPSATETALPQIADAGEIANNPEIANNSEITDAGEIASNPVREQIEGENPVKILFVIMPITLLIMVIFAFVIRHCAMRNITAKKLQSTDGLDTIIMQTKYILNASGLDSDSILADTESYLKRLSESCYKMVTPIIEKAISVKYGSENIKKDDLFELKNHLDSAIVVFYSKQKPLKRFWLRYILNVL